jgi:3-hydroxyacyl-CoA dehydrogenase/enoyl-CoA hydratase/3-hydroxybutyryl-CoA epimerase
MGCHTRHVINASAMGGDMAWCVLPGFTVGLADMKAEPIGKQSSAAELFERSYDNHHRIRDSLDRHIGSARRRRDVRRPHHRSRYQTLSLKQKVYAGIEPKLKVGAVLATNTSSIPLEQLRGG